MIYSTFPDESLPQEYSLTCGKEMMAEGFVAALVLQSQSLGVFSFGMNAADAGNLSPVCKDTENP